jgi:lipopolysaccharide/colanic/teichoic acid biosynthesis glycosyltransferase
MAHLIRIYKNPSLKDLISSSPLIADVFVSAIRNSFPFVSKEKIIAIHKDYQKYFPQCDDKIKFLNNTKSIIPRINRECKNSGHFAVSNGRFITNIEKEFLKEILNTFKEDILTIDVTPELLPYRERIRFNSKSDVVAFRRYSSNSVIPSPLPRDWPCHVFIKTEILDKILFLPSNFSDFINICNKRSLQIRSLNVGGSMLDLEDESQMLQFLINPEILKEYKHSNNGHTSNQNHIFHSGQSQTETRVFGEVLLGSNVHIDNGAIIIGPAIICNNVKIFSKSIIKGSIICPDISLPDGCRVINNIIKSPGQLAQLCPSIATRGTCIETRAASPESQDPSFRIWPKFSYPGFLKRTVDILISSIVLITFLPLLPLISIMIKINSPGPVFFKDKRQGRYGKEFNCIKFRTMIVGAEQMQEKLRLMNQVDGPQFKVANDPRVTKFGKFLRDTYIDEIPQFFNVLLGQMSIVGPRPSPRKENSLCPIWRDARLSVRPGITGLWQVYGTRAPGQDFQEWIYYDIEYVRNLSVLLDISICFKTAKKIIHKILQQLSRLRKSNLTVH